jgi:hypothetical protein
LDPAAKRFLEALPQDLREEEDPTGVHFAHSQFHAGHDYCEKA